MYEIDLKDFTTGFYQFHLKQPVKVSVRDIGEGWVAMDCAQLQVYSAGEDYNDAMRRLWQGTFKKWNETYSDYDDYFEVSFYDED